MCGRFIGYPSLNSRRQTVCVRPPKAWLKNWYPVPEGEYCPATYGQLLRTPLALYVRLVCEEQSPLARQRLPNSPVCTDSCMEFFLNPVPRNNTFINFELNSRGPC